MNVIILPILHTGKSFKNKETFGQFPLQVDGVKDLHESLEMATAQGEIETVNQDPATKSGQEVKEIHTHNFSRRNAILDCVICTFVI